MNVFITGATGFIGRHTVHALLEAGHKVTALCRSAEPEFEALGVTVHRGDVLEPESFASALKGHDILIHGAGFVSRNDEDRSLMMRVHIDGTRFVLEAAKAAGVSRVVHLSTSGTIAVTEENDIVSHEDDEVPLKLISRWPYYLSKWLAERAAFSILKDSDTELVVLNPTLTLGPGDVRGSSTDDVRRYLNREIPIVPSGGFSYVDVRDVANAALMAMSEGENGSRYLLSSINLTCAQFFERLEQVSGVSGPLLNVKVPRGLARFGVRMLEKAAESFGAKAPVNEMDADMSSHFWYVDARKAERDLDFSPRDPMSTLLDTVRDIRGEDIAIS